jgi:hypothetical protein
LGEISLLQPEFLQPTADRQRNIHSFLLGQTQSTINKNKLSIVSQSGKGRDVLDKYSTSP